MTYEAEQIFGRELAWIADPEIRAFTIHAFDLLCPDYFFTRSASNSSKYHPKPMRVKPWGLYWHTKYVAWWVKEMSFAFGVLDNNVNRGKQQVIPDYRDHCISAAILHDMMKDGDPSLKYMRRSSWTILGCHGIDCASAIIREMFYGDMAKMPVKYQLICTGIASHMGRWTEPIEYRPANLPDATHRHVAAIVHCGDFAASRNADAELSDYYELARQCAQPVSVGR